MVQAIVYTDEQEDDRVKFFSKEWKLSKAETIKKMIREFSDDNITLNTGLFNRSKVMALSKGMTTYDFIEKSLSSYLEDCEHEQQIEKLDDGE